MDLKLNMSHWYTLKRMKPITFEIEKRKNSIKTRRARSVIMWDDGILIRNPFIRKYLILMRKRSKINSVEGVEWRVKGQSTYRLL